MTGNPNLDEEYGGDGALPRSRWARMMVVAALGFFAWSVYRVATVGVPLEESGAVIGIRVDSGAGLTETSVTKLLKAGPEVGMVEESLGAGDGDRVLTVIQDLGATVDLHEQGAEADSAGRVLSLRATVDGGAEPLILAIRSDEENVRLLDGEEQEGLGADGFRTIELRGPLSGELATQFRVRLGRCEPGDLVVTRRFVGETASRVLEALRDSVSVADSSRFFVDIRSRETVGEQLTCCGGAEIRDESPQASACEAGKSEDRCETRLRCERTDRGPPLRAH